MIAATTGRGQSEPTGAARGSSAAPAAHVSDTATSPGRRYLDVLERVGLLGMFGIVVGAFAITTPGTFMTVANWQAIAISQSVLAVAAFAMVVPLVGGRFDVSVGSNLGLCSIACATLSADHGWPLLPAIVIAIVIGTLVGLINGVIVAYLGVNSIIATLGVGTILTGFITAYTNGLAISQNLSPTITNLGQDTVVKIPVLFLMMIGIAFLAWFGLTQTPYGRRLAACGSNLRAARLTGTNVGRTIMLSFACSGFLAGVAGVLQTGASGTGDPSVGNIDFIIPSLAAVFLGATTWRPGTYNIVGTVIALMFVGATVSGLTLLGVQPWVTDVFNGAAVVVAIIISAQFRRQRTGTMEVGT